MAPRIVSGKIINERKVKTGGVVKRKRSVKRFWTRKKTRTSKKEVDQKPLEDTQVLQNTEAAEQIEEKIEDKIEDLPPTKDTTESKILKKGGNSADSKCNKKKIVKTKGEIDTKTTKEVEITQNSDATEKLNGSVETTEEAKASGEDEVSEKTEASEKAKASKENKNDKRKREEEGAIERSEDWYNDRAADLPDFQVRDPNEEYGEYSPEELLSSPVPDDEEWSPPCPSCGHFCAAAEKDTEIPNGYARRKHCYKREQYENAEPAIENSEGPVKPSGILKPPTTVRSDWSPAEEGLFYQGLEKHGRNFRLIAQNMLPGRTTKNIVEYFFLWKKTQLGQTHCYRPSVRRRRTLAKRVTATKVSSPGTFSPANNEGIMTRSQIRRFTS